MSDLREAVLLAGELHEKLTKAHADIDVLLKQLSEANEKLNRQAEQLAASVPRTDAEELAEALTLMVGGSVHGGAYDEGKAMAALANWQSKHEAEKPKSRKACDACIACCEECVRVCEREGCRCEGCRQSKHGVKR